MPASHAIDSQLAVIEITGTFSMDEVLQAGLNALADPAFVKGTPLLVDLRQAHDPIPFTEVEKATTFVVANSDRIGGRQAIVVPNSAHFDRAIVHSLRAFELGGVACRVFTRYEDARAWLTEEATR